MLGGGNPCCGGLLDRAVFALTKRVCYVFQVPSSCGAGLNFAPVVPDGYGVCYNPMPDQFKIGVSAWNSSPETSSQKLGRSIEKSMEDSHDLLIRTQKSKL